MVMGRPTNDPKRHEIKIRVSDTDLQVLSDCSELSGKPKAVIVREGIREMYKVYKRKKK